MPKRVNPRGSTRIVKSLDMLVIHNITLYTPDTRFEKAALYIEDGRFSQIMESTSVPIPSHAHVIDATGLTAVPGFIDLQLNGAFGSDFTADPATIWDVSARLPRYGLTSYLPTVITSPLDKIDQARGILLEGRPPNYRGSEPLGLHVEGPFINPQKKGAHKPEYILTPDDQLVAGWSPQSGVRLVTLAPELPGAQAMIEELASRGVVVSAGHSMATYDQAGAGFAAGIRYGTHLFNAMPPMGHREPGLPGALLDNPIAVTGIIPDGIHVHPSLIRLVWAARGSSGLNLVSDAMAALGMPPGKYLLNEFEVTVTEVDCRLADGTLAGAILSIDEALRNLIKFTGCTLSEALATITTTPARLLGIDHQRGRIAPGFIADLVLLHPRFTSSRHYRQWTYRLSAERCKIDAGKGNRIRINCQIQLTCHPPPAARNSIPEIKC